MRDLPRSRRSVAELLAFHDVENGVCFHVVVIALAIFVGAGILGGGLNTIFKTSCEALDDQAQQSTTGVTAGSC